VPLRGDGIAALSYACVNPAHSEERIARKATSDEQLFESGGEQPGSQRSYDRDLEIRRRLFFMEKAASDAQI